MKTEDMKKDTKLETVKIKFKHPMRNKVITHEIYKKVEKEYLVELETQYGRKMILPNIEMMIDMKIQAEYGMPVIFNANQVYEISKDQADYYLSLGTDCIIGDRPRVISKEDLPRFKQKYNYAELVA